MRRIFRNNTLLIGILIISIFFIIKMSNIAILLWLPAFIKEIFTTPTTDNPSFEVYKLLENMSLAYIASFIFYILVDIIPNHK
ncbi:hypothetical protein, partial [Petrocella sp. FN5]|uniref:hypothetical protein n=1 Tax=Petrocella sp. FN5 TaxID=3032002 RepID=UPI0023DAAE02